jgi:PhzF family phenazine biosynthesis protein
MAIPLYQVDAFTSKAFCGNPAAVVILSKKMPDVWMQAVAKEMNLSETAFLLSKQDGFNLRWFTPKKEVDLCGHATLASAHILFEKNYLQPSAIAKFNTLSGTLIAKTSDRWIELDFPKLSLIPIAVNDQISQALGFSPKNVFETDVNILVELENSDDVRNYRPNFLKLSDLPFQGLIITARGNDNEYDFVSRYFAPQAGINEDPVTGSAHCSLAPYWAKKLNKQEFNAYQASERGGILKVKLENERVMIKGEAVTVFSGNLEIQE